MIIKDGNAQFAKISRKTTDLTGKPITFIVVILLILIWCVFGPVTGYSDTWQLVANTTSTLITSIMVFLLQHSQNKDTAAIQLKLNELIASNYNASNRLINIEDLDEEELERLKEYYEELCITAIKIRGKKETKSNGGNIIKGGPI